MLLAVGGIGCDDLKKTREFFQARPVDDNTSFEIDTTPHIGRELPGNVLVDGAAVATATPHKIKPFAPGKHKVRVEAKGYISQEVDYEVKEGEHNQLSLAFKPLPGAPPPTGHATAHGKHAPAKDDGKTKKEHKLGDAEADAEPTVHSSKTFIVTATPAQPVTLDGAALGNGSGLKVVLTQPAGTLRVGEANGISFAIVNKRTGLRLKPTDLGQRSLSLDGTPLTGGKSFEVDSRPRRLELVDVDGNKLVVLMKLVD